MFPALHAHGETGQHREQLGHTTEREHHWERRRHESELESSKAFLFLHSHTRTIMKSPYQSVFMCVQADVFLCTEMHL